jgi:ankyrin repeat protein
LREEYCRDTAVKRDFPPINDGTQIMGDMDDIVLGDEPWRVAMDDEGAIWSTSNLIEIVGLELLLTNADSSGHGHDIPYTTPLLEAVVGNHLHIVQYLLEHCASVVDIHTTSVAHGGDYNGYSVLHFAVLNHNVEMARCLVQQGGCDVDILDYDFGRKSPLHLAVLEGHVNMVQFLVESAGCNVDVMTNNGRTALDIAVADDKFDIVQILMQHSNHRTIDNNAEGENMTMARATKALHVICNIERRPENMEMVQYFVETCRAHVHELDSREYTVLHSACDAGRLRLVQYLVETGRANVESHGETTRVTPVFVACANGHLDIVQYLIEQCRANVRDV